MRSEWTLQYSSSAWDSFFLGQSAGSSLDYSDSNEVPLNASGRQWITNQVLGSCHAPGHKSGGVCFVLAQPWQLLAFGKRSNRWKVFFLCVAPSLSHCLSFIWRFPLFETKVTYIERRNEREKEYLPSTGSHLKELQWPGMGQNEAKSFFLDLLLDSGPKHLVQFLLLS